MTDWKNFNLDVEQPISCFNLRKDSFRSQFLDESQEDQPQNKYLRNSSPPPEHSKKPLDARTVGAPTTQNN